MITRVALLADKHEISSYEIDKINKRFERNNITSKLFHESNDIDQFNPDLVIALSPQHPKLTRFPTYGLMNCPANEYLELPRFVRNLLTYDGYLTTSLKTKQMLDDIMFGARKLNSGVAHFDFTPEIKEYTPLSLEKPQLVYFNPAINNLQFKESIRLLQQELSYFKLYSTRWKFTSSINLIKTEEELLNQYHKYGIGLCLESHNSENKIIPARLLEIIASGAIAITPYTEFLYSIFGDNVLFFSPLLSPQELVKMIQKQLTWITQNPGQAKEKAEKAYKIFQEELSFNKLINNLYQLHTTTQIKKGFISNPTEKNEELPSISYIVRTGGDNRNYLERALNSIVNQNYPKIQVIFVIHKPFDYLQEIVSKYQSLNIKVVQSYCSSRSKAICDGMAAVETDLFGLHDDDDELHPNHVRTLINTLNYHNKRDWRSSIGLAYSGSINISNKDIFETEQEFIDAKLRPQGKKRTIEHFRFYQPLRMANHAWYMMSNSWLARRDLIDSELLTNPEIDTCEDLYFELQFAQRTHFAFSVEITVFHHFHSSNSTIIDKTKHIPDTQRIALRNFSRSFPGEFQYDNVHMPLGKGDACSLISSNYITQLMNHTTSLFNDIENINYPICPPQFYSSYNSYPYKPKGLSETRQPDIYVKNITEANSFAMIPQNKRHSGIAFLTLLRIFGQRHTRRILFYKTISSLRREGGIKTLRKILNYNSMALKTNYFKCTKSKLHLTTTAIKIIYLFRKKKKNLIRSFLKIFHFNRDKINASEEIPQIKD